MTKSARWLDVLSPAEIRELGQFRDWRSWASLLLDWGMVFGSFALVALVPHVLTIVLALFVIGGRQLGLAVLMHEASHRTLFRKRKLNDWAGNWLCAFPIWADMRPYRPYHLEHHARTWTKLDPDLTLATPFPVTRASFARKVWRDLSGQTGWKRAKAVVRRDLGQSAGKTFRGDDAGWHTLIPVIVTNSLLLAVLVLLGWSALYLLWVGAWFTSYSLSMRIRSIAEHSMVLDPADELGNTRTTYANLWERIFIAPNRVNFHLEHHLNIAVPHYNLPRMHRLLRERGALEHALITPGYRELLTQASAGTSAVAAS